MTAGTRRSGGSRGVAAVIALILSVPVAQARPRIREEQLAAFRSAANVRIVVEKSGEAPVPIPDVTRRLFAYAGVPAVSDGTPADLTVRVAVTGRPLGGTYTGFPGETRETLYTGASLKGTIELASQGSSHRRSFSGKVRPSKGVVGGVGRLPFDEAFSQSGSFLPLLFELIEEIYGEPPLRMALKLEGDHEMRSQASAALGKVYVPGSLLRNLDSPDPAAARAEWSDPRAVDILLTLLRNPDFSVRDAATFELGAMAEPRALEPFLTLLEDTAERVRVVAAWGVGRLNDRRAIEGLVRLLEKEPRHSLPAFAATGALRNLTGQKMVGDPEQWRAWWQGEQKKPH